MKRKLTLLTFVIFFSYSVVRSQQIDTPAPSPAAKLEQAVGLINVSVEYSRPSKKGRDIFGGLVPYNEVWRTGANAATKISFSGEVEIGGKKLTAGDYAILTKPAKDKWAVHFYTYEGGSWPSYVQKTPVVIAEAQVESTKNSVESFTIDINNITAGGAHIVFAWDKTAARVPMNVDTKSAVLAQIKRFSDNPMLSLSNSYHNAASYLLAEKTDLENALRFSTEAVKIRPEAFWMSRTKSLIEAELGKYKDAIKTAKASKDAAQKAGNRQYIKFNEDSIAEWSKK